MTGVDLVGWLSSLVLLLTLGQQVRKQWRSNESRGVSTWVFLFTNLALLTNAMLGEWVTLRNRRHARPASQRG